MYRIKRFNCWWSCYKQLKYDFIDKLDNDTLGAILGYSIYYLVSIVGFLVFFTISLVTSTIKIRQIKNHIKNNNVEMLVNLMLDEYIDVPKVSAKIKTKDINIQMSGDFNRLWIEKDGNVKYERHFNYNNKKRMIKNFKKSYKNKKTKEYIININELKGE